MEVDGAPPAVEIAETGTVYDIEWVGADRALVAATGSEIVLWRPDTDMVRRVACEECYEIAASDDELYVMAPGGVLRVLDPADLDPLREVVTELPEQDSRFAQWRYPVAERQGEVFVIASVADGTSAYGGPEEIWAVDATTGASRRVLETGSNVGIHLSAVSADGRRLALGGLGGRGGFCAHYEQVVVLDLESGTLEPLVSIEIDPDFLDGELRITDLFWSGPVLHASALRLGGPECETELGPSLYRYDADLDAWNVVDFGPFDRVRPLGSDPGHKLVTVSGALYHEAAGGSTRMADEVTLVGSTVTPGATDLRLASEVSLPWPAIWVEAWGDLAGARLGEDAEAALQQMSRVLGEPVTDSGWEVGCPLDGPEENERLVRWGSLFARFVRDEAGERFSAWSYRVGADLQPFDGSPSLDLVHLPRGVAFGDPISSVADRLGVPAEPSEMFGVTWVRPLGLEMLSLDSEADGPLTVVAVPFEGVCE